MLDNEVREDPYRFFDVSSLVELDFEELKRETDRAWLVTIDGNDYWLPKSQCDIDIRCCTVWISRWLAENLGLTEREVFN